VSSTNETGNLLTGFKQPSQQHSSERA